MVYDEIVKIIAHYREMDPSLILSDSSFSDLSLDSLDIVDLVMRIEEQFDITLDIDEGIKTIKDLTEAIEKQLH